MTLRLPPDGADIGTIGALTGDQALIAVVAGCFVFLRDQTVSSAKTDRASHRVDKLRDTRNG